jgi:DNA-binding transcriptional ArsR family regulator
MKIYLLQEEIETGFQSLAKQTVSVHRTEEGAEEAMKKLKEGQDPYYRQADYIIEETELL